MTAVAVGLVVGLGWVTLLLFAPREEPTQGGRLEVIAGLYPLAFIADQVGGEHVAVTTLAEPGIEPHDLELSPVDVRSLREARLVLFISEFQPALDDAIDSTDAHGLDAASLVVLRPPASSSNPEAEGAQLDPHFWLDPTLFAEYALGVAEEFAALDPPNADDYRANARALAEDLDALDREFASGLASCERDTIIVSHEAFGYLADRYSLTQIGISGLDPEAEPSPARLREVRALAEQAGATTIYFEALLDPSVVQAFAEDAGLAVASLDPIESIFASPLGDEATYFDQMGLMLEVLREGLGCA